MWSNKIHRFDTNTKSEATLLDTTKFLFEIIHIPINTERVIEFDLLQ